MEDLNKKITLNFKLVTGGTFTVNVDSDISVDLLKKIVSKKLKINKERICLMNSERELQDGSLKDNSIIDGSKIIVTPNVETGLAQRNENTVMQALESLNDNQVNDFLSGKSPLNLSVRLGDHVMLIQLQLSTLSPSQQNSLKQKVANAAALKQQASINKPIVICERNQYSPEVTLVSESHKRQNDDEDESEPQKQRMKSNDLPYDLDNKSPIKSLSSMVASPLTTTVQNMNQNNNKFWASSVDPIAAKLTSCLCKRLNVGCNNNCGHRPEPDYNDPCCSYSSSNAVQPVIHEQPQIIPFHQRPSTSSRIMIKPNPSRSPPLPSPTTSAASPQLSSGTDQQLLNTDNNPALAEASRNLTQTLRKLSRRVFTSKNHLMESSATTSTSLKKPSNNTQSTSTSGSSGAVIESMKHHGKGIYSGTFSGTLNPALQDKNGRPKRDISTIIHILNDLLSATPQCAKNGAKIFFEPTQSSSNSTGKFIKVKKQSSSKATSSCTRCVPSASTSAHQKCTYGQCDGHSKIDVTGPSSSSSSLVPSTVGISRNMCSGCNQTSVYRKLEIENINTKNKLDQLKLVMQQKRERREARKLKIIPYNTQQHGSHVIMGNQSTMTTVLLPQTSAIRSMNETSMMPVSNATNDLKESTNTSSSSSTTATAIATKISQNTSEIENHLEEVDTVA